MAGALKRVGYTVDHQTGSHTIMIHTERVRITVPMHNELAKGTLRAILRQTGISKEHLLQLLR
jgi:predicted RNA binding protein YcfA (HicA-like mRNA interferase family)